MVVKMLLDMVSMVRPNGNISKNDNMKTEFLDVLYALSDLGSGWQQTTTDHIFSCIDGLLLLGDFDIVDSILDEVDISKISSASRRSLLTITAAAKDKLPSRSEMYDRIFFDALLTLGVEKAERIFGKLI
jgi:hypothetical protein